MQRKRKGLSSLQCSHAVVSICDFVNYYLYFIREKEEDDALEQARQQKEQEQAKQVQKMKIERMREAERRRREAVSVSEIFFSCSKMGLIHCCQFTTLCNPLLIRS